MECKHLDFIFGMEFTIISHFLYIHKKDLAINWSKVH